MKFLIVSFLSTLFVSSFALAGSPFERLTCVGEGIKIEAFNEGCVGELKMTMDNQPPLLVEKSCEDSEDRFSFGVEFKKADGTGYDQHYVMGNDGEREAIIVGHLSQPTQSDEHTTIYKTKTDVYLFRGKQAGSVYKNLECDLELFLFHQP